jgi:hypothetical protein
MESNRIMLVDGSKVRFAVGDGGSVLMESDGKQTVLGNMAMAFPLSQRTRLIVLRDSAGREIGILDDIRKLDAASKKIARDQIEKAYFLPRILDITDIREELNVVTMHVVTDRGERSFQVRNVRKNLRRLGDRRLLIKDVDGNRYEIRDWAQLSPPVFVQLQEYL